MHALFIRAPWVEQVGAAVKVIGRVAHSPQPEAENRIIAVQQENLLATSFHPEVTGDRRVHEYFVEMVRARQHCGAAGSGKSERGAGPFRLG